MKNFDKWNIKKKKIDSQKKRRFFEEREIWFLNVGINVGDEQNGDSQKFLRPVLILKKFSYNLFLGIPLTTTIKDGVFYYSFQFRNKTSIAILSQTKTFDAKRFQTSKRYGKLNEMEFLKIKEKYKKLIFGEI